MQQAQEWPFRLHASLQSLWRQSWLACQRHNALACHAKPQIMAAICAGSDCTERKPVCVLHGPDAPLRVVSRITMVKLAIPYNCHSML